ncbi:MAG TPA: threonine/serine dehydratase [Candidatus Baltobacteraceae bacterium]
MIDSSLLTQAAARIAPHVRRTPVFELEAGAFGLDARITLKLESLQHAGSFKARGAFNCMLTNDIGDAGVIAASGGNHGAAVAYAARSLGLRAEIFVPTVSPAIKVERLRRYGAVVNIGGANYNEAHDASLERARQSGAFEVHAFNDPAVVAGAGTTGLEFDEQAPSLDTVLVGVGGGGFIAGIAAWYAGRVKVVGVEPIACPTLHAALAAGRPQTVATGGIAADSLGAKRLGDLAFAIATRYVDCAVLVPDEAIVLAQRRLWDDLQIVAEPGGAAALSALLCGAYVPAPGERVGVLVCGGNADLSRLI